MSFVEKLKDAFNKSDVDYVVAAIRFWDSIIGENIFVDGPLMCMSYYCDEVVELSGLKSTLEDAEIPDYIDYTIDAISYLYYDEEEEEKAAELLHKIIKALMKVIDDDDIDEICSFMDEFDERVKDGNIDENEVDDAIEAIMNGVDPANTF